MSYLLFMDESGHDHRTMPYEVRGGIALHASKLWAFMQGMRDSEEAIFGVPLHRYKTEIKGQKLLDKNRFMWADQGPSLEENARRQHAAAFLSKGVEKRSPTRIEFTAYGQACLAMARAVFRLLQDHGAVLFASAIHRGVKRQMSGGRGELLRKDHVFLLERYFYFLKREREHGLLVMDQTEKEADRVFVRLLRRYFTRTKHGQHRTEWVVPAPLFVSSDMTYPVQAADVCIYCINWGFRLPARGMDARTRPEIAHEFGAALSQLQFRGKGYRNGAVFESYGIVYVPDPYTARGA